MTRYRLLLAFGVLLLALVGVGLAGAGGSYSGAAGEQSESGLPGVPQQPLALDQATLR